MMGQLNHFVNVGEEKVPYAIDRFMIESARLVKVMDDGLAKSAFLGGDDYSIADVACYPCVAVGFPLIKAVKSDIVGEGAAVTQWCAAVGQRPAVKRRMAVPKL